MLDFEVQRCTRHCCQSERELKPGETFYSALVPEGAEVVRYDYASDAWEGPPESAIGWWKSQMPQADAHKLHWAPNDVMLHYFDQLEGQEEKQDVRYILALLMVRRRVMRLEEQELDEEQREVMALYCPRNEKAYHVTVVSPAADRVDDIQRELAELLFRDAD